MNVSKIHSCRGQEAVVLEESEPPAPKCNCRKIITITEATAVVKRGEAKWIVVKRKRGVREVFCSLCKGDKAIKNCAKCSGTGLQEESYVEDIPGTDIVYTSADAVDASERKKRKWLAPKTPRVATIESEHIERAYGDALTKTHPRRWSSKNEARDRIDEYGMLILEARAFVGIDKTFAIGVEPENNPKTGEGRDYDFGRAV